MRPFIHDDFLLQSDVARALYHDVARDLPIVERYFAAARELLPLLVAFARDQHDVAVPGEREGPFDRSAPIGLDLQLRPAAGRLRSFDDPRDDRLRVLRARVVRGDHDVVGEPACRTTHQGTLLAIAIAARPEHTDEPPK